MTTILNYKSRNRSKRAASRRQPNWLRNFTWRMAALFVAAGFVIGYPVYLYVYVAITGGITHQGALAVVDLKAMSSFEMDQDNGTTDNIPQRFRDLEGKRVKLVGQMWAPDTASGPISKFSLVYSRNNCCFNGPPKVQHFVQATVDRKRDVQYIDGFVDVTGILHVGVKQADGHVLSVYRLDVDGVTAD